MNPYNAAGIFVLSLLILGAQSSAALAAPVRLAPGVVPKTADDISAGRPALLQDNYHFRMCDAANGCELWESDGTEAGTLRVTDIGVDTADGLPSGDLMVCNGAVFFSGNDGTAGVELYSYDGANIAQVKDLNAGAADSTPIPLLCLNNVLYFIGSAPGRDLYRTDGTDAGTMLVADTGDTVDSFSLGVSYPEPVALGGQIYFVALNPSGVRQIWKSNGAPAGAGGVTAAVGTQQFTEVSDLTIMGSAVYFSARQVGSVSRELWMTDGMTVTQVTRIGGLDAGSFNAEIGELAVYNAALYFSACNRNNGSGGGANCEFWKSNGVPVDSGGVAALVKDIYVEEGNLNGSSRPMEFTLFNGLLYFAAERFSEVNLSNVRVLMRSDGTTDGTFRIAVSQFRLLGNVVIAGERLVFGNCISVERCAIWGSNGTEATTHPLASRSSDELDLPSNFVSNGTTVFFTQTGGNLVQNEPYAIAVSEVVEGTVAPPAGGGGGGGAPGWNLLLLLLAASLFRRQISIAA